MARRLRYYTILACFTGILTKDPEPELPPCPTNFQFLPQTLPMHCKMPNQAYPAPLAPQFPPQFSPYLPGPPGKLENNPAAPNPVQPAGPMFPPQMPMGMVPSMPMGAPMPMGMPGMPMGMPGMPMGMPGPPMGMPMLGGPPQSKLPVIVMPFYSPDPAYKDPRKNTRKPAKEPYKRKIRIIKKSRHRHDTDKSSDTDTDSSSTDTDSSSGTDRKYWNWKNRRSMRRRKKISHTRNQEYLTPILQYVSKDGYVIFEKQISKGEAKNWLGDNKGPNEEGDNQEPREEHNNHRKDEDGQNQPQPKMVVKHKNNNGDQEHNVVVKYKKNVQRHQRKQSQQTQQQQGSLTKQEQQE